MSLWLAYIICFFSLSVQLKLDVCSFHLSKLVSMVIQCCYRVKVSLYHGLVVCSSSGDQRGAFDFP